MSFPNNLKEILQEQKMQIERFEQEIRAIDALDYIQNNEKLKIELEKISFVNNKTISQNDQLKMENRKLKEALYSQIYTQKMSVLNLSMNRTAKLYADFVDSEDKRLSSVELDYRKRLDSLRENAKLHNLSANRELQENFNHAEHLLSQKIWETKEALQRNSASLNEDISNMYRNFQNEPLSDAQIQDLSHKNNIELKFGGRITNILGVLLILLGVVFGLQYSYVHFLTSNALKSTAAFALGAFFLVAGEALNKKERNVFSLGISAGGLAILFASVGISHLVLGVLSMYPALFVCILVSALAFFLSIRYNSQTIANFALIGGYLPIYAVSFGDSTIIYSTIIYLALLNIFSLLISFEKDWGSVKYMSFILNTLGSGYIIFAGSQPVEISLTYAIVNFSMYVFIAVIHPLRKEKSVGQKAIFLIGSDIFINCLFIFSILFFEDLDSYMGMAALAIAVFYYAFSRYLESKLKNNKIPLLFLLTALLFAVLVVPLQLDSYWVSLGWLFEGGILLSFGILANERLYRRIGAVTLSLCMVAFLLFDFHDVHDIYFMYEVTAITAGFIAVFAVALYKHKDNLSFMNTAQGAYIRVLKIAAILISYIYLFFWVEYGISYWPFNFESVLWILFVFVTCISVVYGYLINFKETFRDGFTEIFSIILFIIAIFSCLVTNIIEKSNLYEGLPFIPVYIIYNALGIFAVFRLLIAAAKKIKMNFQLVPLTMSIFILNIIMQTLLIQVELSFYDMIVSFVLIASALLLIVSGFRFKFPYVRRFGLGLEIVSIVKFFIIDLSFLGAGSRIISYFVLGGVLIGISFVYQYFSKKAFGDIGDIIQTDIKSTETQEDVSHETPNI